MIDLNFNQYCKFMLFIILLADLSTCYDRLTTEEPRLCSPIIKRKLKLHSDSRSGLIVTLGRSSYHTIDWEKNDYCKFQIDAGPSNAGLFAVIQNIVFRKNESTDECIDYVQFRSREGSTSKKYCGRMNAALGMDPLFAADVDITRFTPTMNSFVDPLGQIDVYIYISRESLRIDEEMSLEIVFTSYRDGCYARDDRSCSDQYDRKCIYRGFFNDGYINCPYLGCLDENGCSGEMHEEQKKSIGNKVIIGSVTLLLLLFVVFICFVWLCRRYKKLCWADDFANPTANSSTNQSARNFELNEPSRERPQVSTGGGGSGIGVGVGSSTTPVGTSSTDEDKDLPPSYESLFPDR